MKRLQKTKIILLMLMVFAICLSGCKENYEEDYKIGIVYTKEYKSDTKLVFLDEAMEPVNEINYAYANMSYDGFRNSLQREGKVFFLPKGHGDKLDYGKVISMQLSDGTVEEYDFDRTNITFFCCDENFIYASSNLNSVCYLDRYDRKTGEILSMESENLITDVMAVGEGRLYGFTYDLERDSGYLCEFDIQQQTSTILYHLKSEITPAFLQYDSGMLLFVEDNILYEYKVDEGSMEEIQLPHDSAYNLLVQDGKLYIGYTDLFEEKRSYVDVYDLKKQEVINEVVYDGSILQMEVSKENPNHLFILGYDKLTEIDITDGSVLKQKEGLEEDGFYLGGFFVKEE